MLLWVALALLAVGCSSTRPVPVPPPAEPVPEPPLSEIPAYPDLQKTYDVSAKVCVYPTLWVSTPLEAALRNAGYTLLPALPPANAIRIENPDFIIEPLTFRHTTEERQGSLWLFTRIVLQVRRPARVVSGETDVGNQVPPRIFQVYARRDLGAVSTATEANYRDNVGTAFENLLRIAAFRDALTRGAANGN
jgi:hypothetical protein